MNEETNPTFEMIGRSAVGAIERAQIDAQIATAHAYPKHTSNMLSQVKKDMLSFATLDEDTAAGCFYTLPRGGKTIQGPSVRMAEIAITCYGNIRDAARVIEVVADGETPHVIVQAICHDLERNVAVSIEKRRRITKKKNNPKVDEDDINLAVNACTSIAYRDAAFKVIPLALIKPVVEAAKKVAIGDIKSLAVTRQKCIERLNQMGVPTDRILAVVRCLRVEDVGQAELEILFGLGTALKDGDTSIEDAFPIVVKVESNGKTGVEGLVGRLIKTETPKPPEESDASTQAKVAEQKTRLQEAEETAKAKFGSPEEIQQEQAPETEGPGVFDQSLFVCEHGHGFDTPKWDGRQKSNVCPTCKTKKYQPADEVGLPDNQSMPEPRWSCQCGHTFKEPAKGGSGTLICPKCMGKNIEAPE